MDDVCFMHLAEESDSPPVPGVSLEQRPIRQQTRYRSNNCRGLINYRGTQWVAQVLDFSPQGLCLRLPEPVPESCDIMIRLRCCDVETLPLTAQVRYCHAQEGEFRVGVSISMRSSLNRAAKSSLDAFMVEALSLGAEPVF